MKQVALALCAVLSVVVIGCGDNLEPSDEDCMVIGDEDGNGQADCDDPACSASCLPVCGNGKLEMGEACDDGNATSGDGCDRNCTATGCGNGEVTMNEGCDDGNSMDGDGCDSNCVMTGCGNGILTDGEACDDGNTVSGDGCDTNCTLTACGNNVQTMDEACDDGNLVSGDGCDANCTVTACGNNIMTMGEACDDGNLTDGDGCDSNCTVTACGNTIVTMGEECDDGNADNTDACLDTCVAATCGDNFVYAGVEACDDGNATEGDGCDSNCTISACGNGIQAPDEGCDDGNLTDGDGCDSNCTITACGNGVPTTGEECDDGNGDPADGCTNACTICGNGMQAATEACDDGNLTSGDGCDANCTVTACGNGVPTTGEACDDGNATEGDGCDTNCTVSACGNSIVAPDEECDDGNTTHLDGCGGTCQLEPLEVEPNEDGTPSTGGAGISGNDFGTANPDANGAFTDSVTILAALTPAGDEDIFVFSNTGATRVAVKFDTWNIALGLGTACGTSIDTGIQIRDAMGVSLASNDDRNGAADRCSTTTFPLAPGASVYVHVMEFGDNAVIAGYALQAQYVPVVCGDGTMGPGETCDDGNTTPGDGCDAACTLETTPEVEPNNTLTEAAGNTLQITGDITIQGAITPTADVDMFQLTVATATVVRFETFASLFDCNVTTDVRLFDAAGTPIVADTAGLGISACGSIVRFLDAGTYFVSVEERGNNADIANYFLSVDYQEDRGVETEPTMTTGINDTIATADVNILNGNHVYVFGDHLAADDIDFYSFTVPPLARIRAEVVEGDSASETCDSNGVDSHLTLFNEAGVQIAIDDDNGRGFCSLIDGTGTFPLQAGARNNSLTAQTYYLRVQRSTLAVGQEQTFVYRLVVTIR